MIYFELIGPDWEEKHAGIGELLLELPYVFSPKNRTIVPLLVINSILMQGEINAGMSGWFKWEPLEMSEAEYDVFVEDLVTMNYRSLESTPDWVVDYNTWGI